MNTEDKRKYGEQGPRGEYSEIKLEELEVDLSYQRDKFTEKRAQEIADKWSWPRCRTLLVAIRGDKFFVVDGVHRTVGARKRGDIQTLPCMVFETISQAEEAKIFVDVNNSRNFVTGPDKFKAMLCAGDWSAIGLAKLLATTGHKVGHTPTGRTVSCVMTIWGYYEKNPQMMTSLWPIIVSSAFDSVITDILVQAVWGAEIAANDKNLTLTNHPFNKAIREIGSQAICFAINRERSITGKGGSRICAAALIKELNKKRLGAGTKLEIP